MTYLDLNRRAWRRGQLMSLLCELTYSCNLDCYYCYNDTGLSGERLGTEAWQRVMGEARDLGAVTVTLSGGEPTAHPGFLAIGQHARELGLLVRIKSNGHALRGRLAERIADEVRPYMIEMSLHGASGEAHDRQTRVPGSFARLMDNVRELKALGLRLQFNATLTAWNQDEFARMFAIADELGLPLRFGKEVNARDNGDTEPRSIAAKPEAIAAFDAHLRERAAGAEPGAVSSDDDPAEAGPHCGAGASSATIDPFGSVLPCVQWRMPVGNVHHDSLAEIWRGEALGEVRALGRELPALLGGPAPSFCPALVYQQRGRMDDIPEAARRQRLHLPVVG